MPRLEDATKKPSNIGEIIPPATPTAQQVPPIIPREQPGLGPASLGPAPSLWTTGYDSVRQWARPGTSQGRFPTLPTKANPQLNAAARSVTTTIIKNSPAPAFTGVTSVGLSLPSQFVVSGSPVTSAGILTAAWTSQNPSTFLGVPEPGLSGLEAQNNFKGPSASILSVTATPSTSGTFGLFFGSANGSFTTAAGWTLINADPQNVSWYRSISGTGPVAVVNNFGAPLNSIGSLVIFQGPSPSFVQVKAATSQIGTVTYTANNTAGNTLFVVMQLQDFNPTTGYALTCSDSSGNAYTQIVGVSMPVSGVNPAIYQAVFVAPNCLGGANTVSFSYLGKSLSSRTFSTTIFEFGPLATGASIPSFRLLSQNNIPTINIGTSGNNGVGGIGGLLRTLNGGTGADLSATGGLSRFVKQASTGAPFTVVQPDFSDLAGAAGNFATQYNGASLVSNGIPSEVATVDLTGRGAAIATTTLIPPLSNAGQYRLSWNAKVTTVDATSSTLGPLTITYTDPDGVVQTITAAAQSKAGVIETSDTGNLTTTVLIGLDMMLNCKASTNIQYAMAYASNIAGTMKYNLHIKLEAL